jgi:histone H3
MARSKQTASGIKHVKPTADKPGTPNASSVDTTKNSETDAAKPARKPHRFRPGTVALREIRRFQKGTNLLVQRAPLKRVIREIDGNQHRWNVKAITALHHAAEAYLQDTFAKALYVSVSSGSQTLRTSHLKIVQTLETMA